MGFQTSRLFDDVDSVLSAITILVSMLLHHVGALVVAVVVAVGAMILLRHSQKQQFS